MLVHHVDHPIAEGPQKKEGADQKKDRGVAPTVRSPKKGMTKHGFNPTMDI